MPQIIVALDPIEAPLRMSVGTTDGRFVEVNDALCQFYGYDAATLMQKTWQDLTAPDYLDADLEKSKEVLEGRLDSYRMLKQYIHADGHRIWGDLSVSCVRDENGQVESLVTQVADVTATVEATERNRVLAQQLQQQSDRLAAELDSAAAYMASIMPAGLAGNVLKISTGSGAIIRLTATTAIAACRPASSSISCSSAATTGSTTTTSWSTSPMSPGMASSPRCCRSRCTTCCAREPSASRRCSRRRRRWPN